MILTLVSIYGHCKFTHSSQKSDSTCNLNKKALVVSIILVSFGISSSLFSYILKTLQNPLISSSSSSLLPNMTVINMDEPRMKTDEIIMSNIRNEDKERIMLYNSMIESKNLLLKGGEYEIRILSKGTTVFKKPGKIDVYIDFEKIFTYISTTDYSEQIISYTNKRKKRGVLRIGFVNVDSKDPYPRYLYLKSVTINFIGSSHE